MFEEPFFYALLIIEISFGFVEDICLVAPVMDSLLRSLNSIGSLENDDHKRASAEQLLALSLNMLLFPKPPVVPC